ncbi:hypothetical protein [Nesterenkonia suensis]
MTTTANPTNIDAFPVVQNEDTGKAVKRSFRPLTAVASIVCAGVLAFASVGPAHASGTVQDEEAAAEVAQASQAEIEEHIAEAQAADPAGFEERVAIAQSSATLNAVLNELPGDRAYLEQQALAAAIDDTEALQGTIDLYEMGVFIPYLDHSEELQVTVDEAQLEELIQSQAPSTGEGDVQARGIQMPECAAAWGTALGFVAARYPSCYAAGLVSRVAALTCVAVNFAADQMIDWNAACD